MKRVVCIVWLATLALGAILALAACGAKDLTPPIQDIDMARNQSAKAEIMLVRTAISAYAATNGVAPSGGDAVRLGNVRQPVAREPLDQRSHGARRQEGRHRLHARRRLQLHARRAPLGRDRVHGSVIRRGRLREERRVPAARVAGIASG